MTHDSNLPAPTVATAARPARIEVMDAVPLLDTGKFEHMWRIAKIMASASLCPDALCKNGDEFLPVATVEANCFLVVNQAVRWQFDPFAVAQCTSVVRGKPCYEGKLIAAVLDSKLGVRLEYEWNGEAGEKFGIKIWNPAKPTECVEGSVADWQTKGKNDKINGQWVGRPNQHRMLKYRGDREWARMWRPAIILGVYSPDEMEHLHLEVAARRAMPISERLKKATTGDLAAIEARGFNRAALQERMQSDVVDEATGEVTADATGEAPAAEAVNAPEVVAPVQDETIGASSAEAGEPSAEPGPEPDPRESYSADERRCYEEGRDAHAASAGPQEPKKYRYETTAHLQAAWRRGWLDADAGAPDMLAWPSEQGDA